MFNFCIFFRKTVYAKNTGLLILVFFGHFSCKKMIAVDPPVDSINVRNVFSSDVTAAAAITGIYARMSQANSNDEGSIGGITGLSLFPALSADELTLYDLNNELYPFFYRNELSSSLKGNGNFWNIIYPIIFEINSAIEGITSSSTLTLSVKNQLVGEAKFIRAFCYFYLVNLYGKVPLAITSDWQLNSSLERSTVEVVYGQIIDDLTDAKNLLSSEFLNSDIINTTPDRVRPTKLAATALLARVYLFLERWQDAETEASEVINFTNMFGLIPLIDVFKPNSMEAIWQLQSVDINNNTGEGKLFLLPEEGPSPSYPVYLNNEIVKSFEVGDLRFINWIDSIEVGLNAFYFPNKYKIGVENTSGEKENVMVLRLAEQYLIRSEARAMLNNIIGSQEDLNAIRTRAGLPNTLSNDQSALLSAILKERKS